MLTEFAITFIGLLKETKCERVHTVPKIRLYNRAVTRTLYLTQDNKHLKKARPTNANESQVHPTHSYSNDHKA
jgi:hypothetical protein